MELLISITVAAILIYGSVSITYSILDSQKENNDIDGLRQLANIMSNVVSQNGDIPGGYCHRANGTYGTGVTDCIGIKNYTGVCDGRF